MIFIFNAFPFSMLFASPTRNQISCIVWMWKSPQINWTRNLSRMVLSISNSLASKVKGNFTLWGNFARCKEQSESDHFTENEIWQERVLVGAVHICMQIIQSQWFLGQWFCRGASNVRLNSIKVGSGWAQFWWCHHTVQAMPQVWWDTTQQCKQPISLVRTFSG